VTEHPGPSFADGVVTLTHDETVVLEDMLGWAIRNRLNVRAAIDEGGLKLAIGRHGTWTPALGVLTR
jgi:hypothetical protein